MMHNPNLYGYTAEQRARADEDHAKALRAQMEMEARSAATIQTAMMPGLAGASQDEVNRELRRAYLTAITKALRGG